MNLARSSTPNKWVGGNKCQVIVIHWWDDPAKKPTLEGVVKAFQNPKYEVSAHYVVSGNDAVQMCEETDRAWHAIAANSFGIGIEVDPNTPGNTYKTVGELVRGIRSRHGNIPLKKHSDYVNTRCCGTIDLNRIEKEAKGMQAPLVNGKDYNLKAAEDFVDKFYRNNLLRAPENVQATKGRHYGELYEGGVNELSKRLKDALKQLEEAKKANVALDKLNKVREIVNG